MLHENELGWRVADATMGDIFAYTVCNDMAAFFKTLPRVDEDTVPSDILATRLNQEVLTHAYYVSRCSSELPKYLTNNPAIMSNMDGLAELADLLVSDEHNAQRLAVMVASSAVVAIGTAARIAYPDGRQAMAALQTSLKDVYKSHAQQWASRATRIIARHPNLPRNISLFRVRKDPGSGKYALHMLREDL